MNIVLSLQADRVMNTEELWNDIERQLLLIRFKEKEEWLTTEGFV